MGKIAIFSVFPVVSAADRGPVRVVLLFAIRVNDLFEVLGHKVVAWVFCTPLSCRSLLFLKSVFLRCRKVNVVVFKSTQVRPQSAVRDGQALFESFGQVIQLHREVSEVVLPVILVRHGVSLPDAFFLRILHLREEFLRPFAFHFAQNFRLILL